jgi:hypothetical protein
VPQLKPQTTKPLESLMPAPPVLVEEVVPPVRARCRPPPDTPAPRSLPRPCAPSPA